MGAPSGWEKSILLLAAAPMDFTVFFSSISTCGLMRLNGVTTGLVPKDAYIGMAAASYWLILNDTEKDMVMSPDADLSALSADNFDALVIPGRTVNADNPQFIHRFGDASYHTVRTDILNAGGEWAHSLQTPATRSATTSEP
jgi:hypothetical protein